MGGSDTVVEIAVEAPAVDERGLIRGPGGAGGIGAGLHLCEIAETVGVRVAAAVGGGQVAEVGDFPRIPEAVTVGVGPRGGVGGIGAGRVLREIRGAVTVEIAGAVLGGLAAKVGDLPRIQEAVGIGIVWRGGGDGGVGTGGVFLEIGETVGVGIAGAILRGGVAEVESLPSVLEAVVIGVRVDFVERVREIGGRKRVDVNVVEVEVGGAAVRHDDEGLQRIRGGGVAEIPRAIRGDDFRLGGVGGVAVALHVDAEGVGGGVGHEPDVIPNPARHVEQRSTIAKATGIAAGAIARAEAPVGVGRVVLDLESAEIGQRGGILVGETEGDVVREARQPHAIKEGAARGVGNGRGQELVGVVDAGVLEHLVRGDVRVGDDGGGRGVAGRDDPAVLTADGTVVQGVKSVHRLVSGVGLPKATRQQCGSRKLERTQGSHKNFGIWGKISGRSADCSHGRSRPQFGQRLGRFNV